MTDPTLTIAITRLLLPGSLDPLEFSGSLEGAELGIVAYSPPSFMRQVEYMPDSVDVDGSEAIASRRLHGMLGFSWTPVAAATETEVQAAAAVVDAALGQFNFEVTTQVAGAPAQVWSADPGSMTLGGSNGRTFIDLKYRTPIYSVTIPVYPIAT